MTFNFINLDQSSEVGVGGRWQSVTVKNKESFIVIMFTLQKHGGATKTLVRVSAGY